MLDLVLPERCAVCERPGRSAVRAVPTRRSSGFDLPVCERCGSPGPWPVRRCAECAGRRLAFVERAVGDRLRRTARRLRARLEGARTASARARCRACSSPRSFRDRRSTCVVPVPGDPERAWRRGDVPSRGRSRASSGAIWRLRDARRARAKPRASAAAWTRRSTSARRNVRGSVVARRSRPRARLRRRRRVHVGRDRSSVRERRVGGSGARRVRVVTLARAVR